VSNLLIETPLVEPQHSKQGWAAFASPSPMQTKNGEHTIDRMVSSRPSTQSFGSHNRVIGMFLKRGLTRVPVVSVIKCYV